jgi:hypothetical protein
MNKIICFFGFIFPFVGILEQRDYMFTSLNEALSLVQFNQKWGFIDKEGKDVISIKYENANTFEEGLASVQINEKWGFIDKTGKEVIPIKYNEVSSFSEGKAEVTLNGRTFYIDKKGNEIK